MRWASVRAVVLGLTAVLGACACACSHHAGRTAEPASSMSAKRIYTLAEQHVAAHRYPEAVDLIRHALLQLPETEDADELRHALVLRLAYVQMLAYQQTKNHAYVDDAQRMLERYLAKHEALFGNGDDASAERGEVYEILYSVETLPERVSADEAKSEEPRVQQTKPVEREEEFEEPIDTHAGEDLEAEMHRDVRVRERSRLAQPDDPRVRRRLESSFSDAQAGLLLTAPGYDLVHGPRPLVRARRASSADARTPDADKLARRLGRELLVNARPQLRACYAAAFARTTVALTEGTIEASILPDGTVAKARVVDGGLVDAAGDVCLIEGLEATRVAADTTRGETRVRIPLVFFYEGAVYIDAASGRGAGAAPLLPPTQSGTAPRQVGAPIDRFDK